MQNVSVSYILHFELCILHLSVATHNQNGLEFRVLRYIRERELMRAGDRVGVAVSGGADSVGLLRLLIELRGDLGIVLCAIHVNHSLRGAESDADEAFVIQLAEQLGLEAHRRCADALKHSKEHNLSVEAAGHELRACAFLEIAHEQQLNCVATAHTLDDQAETVLLKLLRGGWTRGLAGIYPVVEFRREDPAGIRLRSGQAPEIKEHKGERLVRPLLEVRRTELREYLTALKQTWREDKTNADVSLTRNRVRHELLPLLERDFHPGIAEVLSGTAELARAEQQFWDELARVLWESCATERSIIPGGLRWRFDVRQFRTLQVAEQRRAVEFALHRIMPLDFRHVEAARLALLAGKATASLPGGFDLTLTPDGNLLVARRLGPPEPKT